MPHADTITLFGNPVTLRGEARRVGDLAPDATLVGNDLTPVKLSDYAGKVRVLSAVPSLDTPVCDLETRRFNAEAADLGDNVVILTISMDLPFAQARWCAAAGIDRVITLSDHRDAAFGLGYGQLIDEVRLLARAIFVVDRDNVIRYIQQVPEISQEPDYAAVLAAVRAAL